MEEQREQMSTVQFNIFIGLVGVIFALLCIFVWVKPDGEYSVSERRLLKQMPEFSNKALLSGRFMSAFEDYSLDQFPFRDTFRRMKVMTILKLDNNGIYVVDEVINGENHEVICDMDYPLEEDSLRYASKRFQNVYDMYLKDHNCQVYLSIVPDKNYFYASEHGYLVMDYDRLVNIMLDKNTNMTYIDIFPYLSGEDYYRTDIHWRQEQIADVADVLLKEMKQETVPEENKTGGRGQKETGQEKAEQQQTQKLQYHTMKVDGNFCGVYYGQAALPIIPDKLQYLTNDTIEQMKVFDFQNDKEIPVYDEEKIHENDPYELFVGGPISLATIENPVCENGKQLIIFRDSFGSSIAPLLAQGYSKTTLIDIRYIQPAMLQNYVDFQDADVVFLYSTPVLNHSETLK